MKKRLYPDFLEKDRPVQPDETIGSATLLEVQTAQGRVQGIVLSPNHREGETHPAVLMLHGFPGIASNQELGQTLRKFGFVAIMPFAPGAWGSDGTYSFDGIVDAACEVAEYIHSTSFCGKYAIDPESIFLFGHSMGGFAAIHAVTKLPWKKAVVLAAPCDLDWYFQSGDLRFIDSLPEEGARVLKTKENLRDNAVRIHRAYAFSAAYPALEKKNLLLIECSMDAEIPSEMLRPLKERILAHNSQCCRQSYVLLPTDHAFNDSKNRIAQVIADFLIPLVE